MCTNFQICLLIICHVLIECSLNGVECAGEEERLSGFEQNLSINSIAIPTTMECFVRSLRGNFSNDGILYK